MQPTQEDMNTEKEREKTSAKNQRRERGGNVTQKKELTDVQRTSLVKNGYLKI